MNKPTERPGRPLFESIQTDRDVVEPKVIVETGLILVRGRRIKKKGQPTHHDDFLYEEQRDHSKDSRVA